MNDWTDCYAINENGNEVRVDGVGFGGGGRPLPHYGYGPDPRPCWEQFPNIFEAVPVVCETCGVEFLSPGTRNDEGPAPWYRFCPTCTEEWRRNHR